MVPSYPLDQLTLHHLAVLEVTLARIQTAVEKTELPTPSGHGLSSSSSLALTIPITLGLSIQAFSVIGLGSLGAELFAHSFDVHHTGPSPLCTAQRQLLDSPSFPLESMSTPLSSSIGLSGSRVVVLQAVRRNQVAALSLLAQVQFRLLLAAGPSN